MINVTNVCVAEKIKLLHMRYALAFKKYFQISTERYRDQSTALKK